MANQGRLCDTAAVSAVRHRPSARDADVAAESPSGDLCRRRYRVRHLHRVGNILREVAVCLSKGQQPEDAAERDEEPDDAGETPMILILAKTAIVVGAVLIILSAFVLQVVALWGTGVVLVAVGAFVWQRKRRTVEKDDVA